ncbi:MAG TPA: hypothetical protein VHO24_14565 [Opitutaceae bacterium]|nr:hypothetical protein [Opitutaceae bacterium]
MTPIPTRSRLLALACFCLLPASGALAADITSYVAGKSFLAIDGVYCAPLREWHGGDAAGETIVESSVAGAVPKKHVGNVRYEPISVKLAFPPTAPVLTLLTDFLANKTVTKNITLTDLTYDMKPAGAPLEGSHAMLVEVKFEDWDAAGKEPATFTLVFAPEYTRAGIVALTPPTSPPGSTKNVQTSGFRFRLGAWPANQVNRVAALSIKRRLPVDAIGSARSYEITPAPVEFPSLVVTLAESQAADWKLWADDFLVKGNNSDAHEKTATLELLDNALTPVLSLQFFNVGITRLFRPPLDAGSEAIRRLQAELYFERMAITPPPATLVTAIVGVATAVAPATPLAAPAATSTTAATPGATPVATPVGTVTPVTAPVSGGTTTAPRGEIAAEPVGKTPAGTTAATTPAAGTSSADQGARDPANFPRLAGLTRKTYSSNRSATLSDETAIYSTKLSFDEVVSAYEDLLKADGWEQTMRNESGDPVSGTHQFRLRWAKAPRSVEIRLTQPKSGGTEVSVSVSSTRG